MAPGRRWLAILLAGAAALPVRSGIGADGKQDAAIRLVILVVVDQMRADYLDRFGNLLGEGGFARLMTEGAQFTTCRFAHGVTRTGPGHAGIATGTTPSANGIVGNEWLERRGGKLQEIGCVSDPEARTLGASSAAGGGCSSRYLQVQTLGDQMKAADAGCRVVACSLKDRAAVLLGGRLADSAWWWDYRSGRMVTSSAYLAQLPSWAASFNGAAPADQYFNRAWTRLLPAEAYDARCRRDNVPYEWGERSGGSNAFPHALQAENQLIDEAYYRAVYNSPFGNELVLQFARHAVAGMQLGQRDATDALLISLSSNDVVGHNFGPYSHEVMDITLATDRQLADFLQFIDRQVGLSRCLVVLTSDHGACMVPEYAIERGLPGGRISPRVLEDRIDDHLTRTFGPPASAKRRVVWLKIPWLWLEPAELASIPGESLRRAIDEVVRQEPAIAALYLADDIQKPDFAGSDPLRARVQASYYAGRSGHLYLHLAENFYADSKACGHGTAHDYDTHVPLLMMGPGVRAGRYPAPCAPRDIVPTLARLLGIPSPPQATGRVLAEALQAEIPAPPPRSPKQAVPSWSADDASSASPDRERRPDVPDRDHQRR